MSSSPSKDIFSLKNAGNNKSCLPRRNKSVTKSYQPAEANCFSESTLSKVTEWLILLNVSEFDNLIL